jgi:hypothetical protein
MVEEARALVAAHARCSAADACSVVQMGDYAGANNCVLPLEVLAALRANTDFEELSAHARDLVKRYNAACSTCALPAAQDPAWFTAVCDDAAERCVLVRR